MGSPDVPAQVHLQQRQNRDIYITTTGDNTLELPTPLDVEGYLCGLVELTGRVVNLKGDLFLCCDFCEESVVGNIKLPVL